MLPALWLTCKRLAVLAPGIIVVAVFAGVIVPYFSQRVHFAIVVALAYLLAAYVIIPAIWRTLRLMAPAKHLPLYCTTPDGFASDPINIGLIGSRRQLVETMEAAGWQIARPITPRSITHTMYAIIFDRSFPTTPMSSLYLFGRKQDISFERELIEEGRGHRQHVRFWATSLIDLEDAGPIKVKHLNHKERQAADKLLWAGAASHDIGITFAKGVLQLTHAVASNTNYARGTIIRQLESLDLAKLLSLIRLDNPYRLPNFAWSRTLQSDGQMAVMELTKEPADLTIDN